MGMLYGWLIANDSFWPSISATFLGLSSYSTDTRRPEGWLRQFSTVLLLFFFCRLYQHHPSAAGITEYIARWIVSSQGCADDHIC